MQTTATATNTPWVMPVSDDYVAQMSAFYFPGSAPTAATPTFSPVAGAYTSSQSVTISSSTSGASIYYTTDGTTPTTSSTLYSGPVTVASSGAINAIAVKTGFINSGVATASYTINLPALLPRYRLPRQVITRERRRWRLPIRHSVRRCSARPMATRRRRLLAHMPDRSPYPPRRRFNVSLWRLVSRRARWEEGHILSVPPRRQ